MKAKDIDNKEIKLDLTIKLFPEEIKECVLSRVGENEEFTEESLKTFIIRELANDWMSFLDAAKIIIKDK